MEKTDLINKLPRQVIASMLYGSLADYIKLPTDERWNELCRSCSIAVFKHMIEHEGQAQLKEDLRLLEQAKRLLTIKNNN